MGAVAASDIVQGAPRIDAAITKRARAPRPPLEWVAEVGGTFPKSGGVEAGAGGSRKKRGLPLCARAARWIAR